MYNRDQCYEAHTLHLKVLCDQVKQCRLIAALTEHRHTTVRAAGMRLRVLLLTLGTWLARSARRDERPA